MRKTLIALMLAAALPTAAVLASPEKGGPDAAPHMMQGDHGPKDGQRGDRGPFGDLDLTKEQRQQIGKLMGDQMESRRELTKKYLDKLPAADKKAMEDEIKAAHAKNDSAIRALLTPEQQKRFDEKQKKMEERRAEHAEFEAWKAEKAKKQ
jgi:protein CpxP